MGAPRAHGVCPPGRRPAPAKLPPGACSPPGEAGVWGARMVLAWSHTWEVGSDTGVRRAWAAEDEGEAEGSASRTSLGLAVCGAML